ncbi:MAG: TetR/AcrR family transcriptional repressor of nem operon [Gammaproteobacteria bacterium]|jgi:TetR/AcrR family transcriptional repressor of nem operon
MARPRQFDENQVIQKVMEIFWEKGYEATSLANLIRVTGLQKGSLYGAFGNKQNLYLLALKHYEQNHIQAAVHRLNDDSPVDSKISFLFDSIIESMQSGVFAGGCLLCDASLEMAAIDHQVQKSVEAMIERLLRSVRSALEQDSYPDTKLDSTADFIIASYFGCRIYARAGVNSNHIRHTRDICIETLTGLKQ